MLRTLFILLSVLFMVSCGSPQPGPVDPETPQPGSPDPDNPNNPQPEGPGVDPSDPSNPEPPSSPEPDEAPDFDEGDEPGADLPEGSAELGACANDAAKASSVYVSPLGNDSADGRSPGTAWQSLKKVSDAMPFLTAGTQVLLERGAVFRGTLELDGVQGNAASPYTLGAYCQGDAPIITGFVEQTEWGSAGANLWETTCTACPDDAALLRLDGDIQALGRWPNRDDKNEGYLLYDDFEGRTSLSDAELSQTDWSGAAAVVRTRPWVLDRMNIERISGDTMTLGEGSTYDFWAGGGYFIQNHPDTLDQNGEWAYDAATSTLQLYSETDPNTRIIQTSDTANLISLVGSSHITFQDIRLEGASGANVTGASCSDIRFSNISVQDSDKGIILDTCKNIEVTDSTLRSTLDNGLDLSQCDGCKVTGALLEDIAIFPGMGENGNYHYIGLQLGGAGSVVEYSEVNGVGHVPIIARSFSKVRYNKILNYHLTKLDGGGVYTYAANDIEIHNNIIARGLGTKTAIPWNTTLTNGIYIDQRSRNLRVYDNTLAYTTGSGIKVHSSQNNIIENNTVFAAQEAALELIEYVEPGELKNNTIRNNQFIIKGADTYYMSVPTPNEASYFSALGTLSNNTYCAPFNSSSIYQPYVNSAPAQHYSSLATWQTLYNQDQGSSLCDFNYTLHRNVNASANRISDSSFDDADAAAWNTEDAQMSVQDGRLRATTDKFGGVVYTSVGSVDADSLYRLTFDAATELELSDVRARFVGFNDDGKIEAASRIKLVSAGQDSSTFELFMRPVEDGESYLGFYIAQRDGPLFLDNIKFSEVSANQVDFEDKVKLFANPSKTTESFSLDGSYVDIEGKSYSGSVSVAPYESVVLFSKD